MLRRQLPRPTYKLGDSTITVSRNICGQLAKAAGDEAHTQSKTLADGDPLETLEQAHVTQDQLLLLIPQASAKALDYTTAADILEGKTLVEGNSPLIAMALEARVAFDTIKAMAPDLDIDDMTRDAANALRAAGDALLEDARVLKSRTLRHDMACRKLTVQALTIKGIDHQDVLNTYETPDDFQQPPRMSSEAFKERFKAGDHTTPTQKFASDLHRAVIKDERSLRQMADDLDSGVMLKDARNAARAIAS